MATSLHERLDQFGRRHPRLMLATTIFVGFVTTLILVYHTRDTTIVYKAF
jgi:hypothetical protein